MPSTHNCSGAYSSNEAIRAELPLKQLGFIRQGKALDFTLEEIDDIVRSLGRGYCPCTDEIAIAECHLRDVGEQIHALEKLMCGVSINLLVA